LILLWTAARSDVTPDGQRFVVLEPVEKELAPVTHLNVVLNWFEDVKKKTAPRALQVR